MDKIFKANNPLGISSNTDKIAFHPYYTYKDLLGAILFFIFFLFFVFFAPNVLGQRKNGPHILKILWWNELYAGNSESSLYLPYN